MKTPPITETEEGTAVADFLANCLAGNTVPFFVPNEHASKAERIKATAAGALWGHPDWGVYDGSRAITFELKPRGWRDKKLVRCTQKLTRHELRQLAVHERIRGAGVPVAICETLGEVVWYLQRLGVPMLNTDVEPTPIPAAEAIRARIALPQPRAAVDRIDRLFRGSGAE